MAISLSPPERRQGQRPLAQTSRAPNGPPSFETDLRSLLRMRLTTRDAQKIRSGLQLTVTRSNTLLHQREASTLLRRHLLALEVAETGTIALLVQELLHARLTAVFLVVVLERVALGIEVVGRLRLVHEAHRADAFLGVLQHRRGLLHQLLGERDGPFPQLVLREGEIDEAHLLRLLAVEGIAGHGVVHGVTEVQRLHDVPGYDAARQDAPVHFGKAENGVVGRDREIAGADLREAAAETEAVDHGNGWLRKRREFLPAPLIGGAACLRPRLRILFGAAEVEPDVLAGAEGFARACDDENFGLLIG